jgi:hypothetical protein
LYVQALRTYEEIHRTHPENVECLEYLIRIYKDQKDLDRVAEFQARLRACRGGGIQKLRQRQRQRATAAAAAQHITPKGARAGRPGETPEGFVWRWRGGGCGRNQRAGASREGRGEMVKFTVLWDAYVA